MARRELTCDVAARFGRDVETEDLIVVMQDEEELREQREIVEAMKPPLREKYEKIRELIETEVHAVLRNRYELGEHFQALYDDETNNGATIYGKHAVDNICRLLGIDKGIVRSCMKFVTLYSRGDLEKLCNRQLPRGEGLTWSHIRALVQVEDTSRRDDLLEKTFDEGWTCNELSDAVRSDGDPNSNIGRPLKIPASFDGMVQQQLQAAEKWEKRSQKVWDHPERSLLVKAAELSYEDITEERLMEAEVLAHRLRGMAVEANKAAVKAEAVVRDFKRILEERKAAQESKDEEPKTKYGHERKPKACKGKMSASAK